jgi:hypothetical protein
VYITELKYISESQIKLVISKRQDPTAEVKCEMAKKNKTFTVANWRQG